MLDSGASKVGPWGSYHQFGRAIDVTFETARGTPTWSNTTKDEQADWLALGIMGEQIGFEWGGRWKTLVDLGHFQNTGGMTTAELKAELDA